MAFENSIMSKNKTKKTFSYSLTDLVIYSKDDESEFDKLLQSSWAHAMEAGYFNYQLGDLKTKIVSPKYHFVAQLNVKRATERRKPLPFNKIQEPFNDETFNFKKINENEILLELQPNHWTNSDSISDQVKEDNPLHKVIINVSPLENCHSLLVPFCNYSYPQILTPNSLRLAIEVTLLSKRCSFHVGYNSLGAFASVNHLHFHLYYLKNPLYVETVTVSHLAGACFELLEYPANGFAFQIVDLEVGKITNAIFKLISYLLKNDIAHNVFITRGSSFSNKTDEKVVRVFVWARYFYSGAKDDFSFNAAVCELAGHIPVKSEMFFSRITEKDIESVIQNACQDVFWKIRDDVKLLFS